DDPGYKFDDYGQGLRLALPYLAPVADLGIAAFFPKLPSAQESGLKRGWVVLAADPASIEELRQIDLLRPWTRSFAEWAARALARPATSPRRPAPSPS